MPPWYYGEEWYDEDEAYLSTIGKKKTKTSSEPKVVVGPDNPAYDPVLAAAADKEDEEAEVAELREQFHDGQENIVGKFWKNITTRHRKN